jgi:phosphoribosylglycinamide formyltransferase-1
VNEEYDKGEIILQKECALHEFDTPESLAKKIHELEMEFLPKAIETLL